MLRSEAAARNGEIEGVHQMRVATRRMRSAWDIFEPYFEKSETKHFRRLLRKTARALGAVRDIDVFRERSDRFAAKTTADTRSGLQPLHDALDRQRNTARDALCDLLDSLSHETFIVEFAAFVQTADLYARELSDEQPIPCIVRHCAGMFVFERMAACRAYAPVLTTASLDTLHALRIAAKQLRYAVECFEEVLTRDSKVVINAAKGLQDHLGELQDARVATALMAEFIANGGEDQSMKGLLKYLGVRQDERQKLRAAVGQAWSAFDSADVRRALALCVAEL
jgi:CHAD domain-containing protein